MTNQEMCLEKLSKLKCGALFMDMGTGKTKTMLDIITLKYHKVDSVVWICPCSLKGEIESERLKWHPEIELKIIGCETIGSSDRQYLELLEFVKTHKCMIVVDESLKIKNPKAKRTDRILELGLHAEYRFVLNGTPISKNVLDLWSQMYFLSPKILNMSHVTFKNTYCEFYTKGELKGLVRDQHNLEHLYSLISPYVFESALDLDVDKHYHTVPYYLQDVSRYETAKQEMLDNYQEGSDIWFFMFCTRLQTIMTDSYKRELQDLLQKIPQDEQVVVFVKYLKNIPAGEHALTGDIKKSERDTIIKEFKDGKIRVLYMTYGCGAYGLNLQNAHNIVFADNTFDYSERLQAEHRIYRMGQEHEVNYYTLECNTGLEALILASIGKKKRLLSEIKDLISTDKESTISWLKSM